MNWLVSNGMWQGWFAVYLNGVPLGQLSHYCAAGALKMAQDRYLAEISL